MHALEPHINDIDIFIYLNIKSDIFWNFEIAKFYQNIPQNAPSCIILKKKFGGGACPRAS